MREKMAAASRLYPGPDVVRQDVGRFRRGVVTGHQRIHLLPVFGEDAEFLVHRHLPRRRQLLHELQQATVVA